jgi:hypothetical protein
LTASNRTRRIGPPRPSNAADADRGRKKTRADEPGGERDVSRFAEPISSIRTVERAGRSYYSFPDGEGGWNGLLRVDGATYWRVEKRKWVEDNDLARYFVNPGADGPELIDLELAQRLAERYGVER